MFKSILTSVSVTLEVFVTGSHKLLKDANEVPMRG